MIGRDEWQPEGDMVWMQGGVAYVDGPPEPGDGAPAPVYQAPARAQQPAAGQPMAEQPQLDQWPTFPEPFDVGLDLDQIPPREWLLGNTFCKHFLSGLSGRGGSGKTALRIAQLMSVALGRSLTGEHVWRQANVMIVSFEDGRNELRRRVRACMRHHKVKASELLGKFFILITNAKIASFELPSKDFPGGLLEGPLYSELVQEIKKRNIEIVCLDPFVKSHGVKEGDNQQIDFVMNTLSAVSENTGGCVMDLLHHENKARHEDAADRDRGASSRVDAGRLMYSLVPMSKGDADTLGLLPQDAKYLVRLDRAKVNIAAPDDNTMWFRLVGVELDNATEKYPAGDTVQTVERWQPPNISNNSSLRKLTQKALALRELHNLVVDIGEAIPMMKGVPFGVRGTTLERWKEHLIRVGVLDSTDPDVRKRFWEVRTRLRTDQLIGINGEYVWASA